ncbi:MAG: cell division protein FtsZ [Methanobacteriota archaeon]|nr:MAG: cell division protein FtsZ [Euryarchaeota archaeon]
MVKSIVSQALARQEAERVKEEPAEKVALPKSAEDDEIAKIVESLNVSIKIIGCGGGGSNTVNRCSEAGITGAQLCAINTDAKHLLAIHAPKKILIGKRLTKGLGAGALPEVGEQAAHESEEEIREFLRGAHVAFVTAGMGGGTGTGAAQYVAHLAKEEGALVMGVVTMPFRSEGKIRMENAEAGLDKLRKFCDTTIVIYNDKLLEMVPRLPIDAAFKVADEILMQSIKGMTEIITKPGLVNLDYADLMTIMKGGGVAMIGIGESEEERDRVEYAISEALESPLLGEVDLTHARGALVRVVGGPDLTVSEAEKAAEIVGQKINPMARIIWGCTVEPSLERTVRVLLVITGVKSKAFLGKESNPVFASSQDVDEVR